MWRMIRTILLAMLFAGAAFAQEGEQQGVGYGGAKVQMQPIMAPYRTTSGIRYEVLTVQLTLDAGPRERPACFSVPILHDRMVAYLYEANLTAADFVGQRRDVLAKNLFDLAVKTVGRGFYSAVEIIDIEPRPTGSTAPPPMDPKSMTLSAQCK
jgi:hypothetical protein